MGAKPAGTRPESWNPVRVMSGRGDVERAGVAGGTSDAGRPSGLGELCRLLSSLMLQSVGYKVGQG